jgi:hypothetical protein
MNTPFKRFLLPTHNTTGYVEVNYQLNFRLTSI